MPRNVRNFWIELDVDGSRSQVATGPRNADGGFRLSIKQRDNGGIAHTLTVDGRVSDGRLVLKAYTPDGRAVSVITGR